MSRCTVLYGKVKTIIQNRSGILYLLFLLMMILALASKKNLHVDEVFTYGLSNYAEGTTITPIEEETYSPVESFYLEYMTVHKDARFDYRNVWENQLGDTHPPLYYMLVHTICSLFPGKFSIWYAGIINVIFALLTLYVIRCFVYTLTQNEDAVLFISLMFIFSAGILSSVTFLRMYTMVMFEVSLITLLFVRAMLAEYTWKFYIQAIIISVAGALTHYYFIVYLFFLCLFFGIYLLVNRRIKDMGVLTLSMVISGGLSIAIFPGMIKHMFLKEGYRGQEAISNLKQFSLREYGDRLKGFYSFMNEQLFGGILTYMLIIALFFYIYRFIKNEGGGIRRFKAYWIVAIVPGICYFFLVSKMASYIASRYLSPVYAVILSVVAVLLYCAVDQIVKGRKQSIAFVMLISIMIVNDWKLCNWEYLYLDNVALLKEADEYSETNCLYIYDINWKIYSSFYELSRYKSVTFVNQNNLNTINNFSHKNDMDLVVSIINSCDTENILDYILSVSPFLDSYEKIGGFGYATSWHLSGRELGIQQYRIKDYENQKVIGCQETSIGENICMTVRDGMIKCISDKDTEYETLWIGNCVFDIENGIIEEGSNIRLWSYNGTNAQLWKLQKNTDDSYTFLSQNENLAITRAVDGNIYLDKLKPDDASQKWWLETNG